MSHSAPTPAQITGWDRAAIVALGGAGCALSYDALQQMATAIHVRGPLTFLFPLVIDGFIAYGVRALLVLRTASFAARLYVWALFGTATAASIWANALHAVRLNQQRSGGGGLRLGDVTVGALSTLAPLALAGAVHLYILIARRVTEARHHGHPDTFTVRTDRIAADRRDTPLAADGPRPVPAASHSATLSRPESGRPAVTSGPNAPRTADREEPSGHPASAPEARQVHGGEATDLGGQPVSRPVPVTRLRLAAPTVTEPETSPDTASETSDNGGPDTPASADTLLSIARQAVADAGKVTREVVADAIRGQGKTLANDRLTALMQQLRAETGQKSATKTG
ncbi:DUF2637 domain-containing protein [Streptomyces violaceochromogenes]|uniref:DUF2637 domain-containing protein n=1 Tax=Streptomyces violaceochromogenes TaxID=67377 RepID=A0ABU6M1I5_9ACTN|nr:DUF2637 domain-containing protein [Streptomyces violaceochromogenes]MEC7055641.1 DUF2637 domain-containing protein [Streptomyces violaceochromogenes]GHC74272.1 hypothetical protein GCM10010309_45040 [Streptomyces violaceochromogenes]